MQKMLDTQYTLLLDTAKQRIGDYLVRVATTEPDNAETAIYFLSLAPTIVLKPVSSARGESEVTTIDQRARQPVRRAARQVEPLRELNQIEHVVRQRLNYVEPTQKGLRAPAARIALQNTLHRCRS